MLPLYLSIEGLYSYQQKQEIDFTALTEAGLFGIFGSVGSGKSSVLEAIGYALYGETERLNSKEKRTYNMMNLKSSQVIIDFQFLNFEGRKFRFVAQWRRKKKFQDITDHERNAYEWIDGNWSPMESNDGAAVTNLSYSNFRRTIIIPQGQFKEFLELKGKDRSEMMKEIFFLNQYDLGPKVSGLMADNNKKIEHLKGALSGFEEVNTEIIEEKNQQFQELSLSLESLKKEFEQLDFHFKALQIAKQNRIDLEIKQGELAALNERKPAIQKIEAELNEYELVLNNFREPLNNLSQITTSKNALLTKIEGLKESKDATKTALTEVEQALEQLLPQYQNLDNLKAEIQDIKRLIQNVEFGKIKADKEVGIIKGNDFLIEQKQTAETLLKDIEQQESAIEKLKSSRINSSELLAIDSWYQRNEQLAQDLKEEHERVTNIQSQIEELKNQFVLNGYTQSEWQQQIEDKFEGLEQRDAILKKQDSDIRLKQELSHYIHSLHDGEPCPLCGSAEHPSPMEIEALDEEIARLHSDKNQLQQEKEILEKQKAELQLNSKILAEKEIESTKLQQEITKIENLFQLHQQAFVWDDFHKDNRTVFETKKNEIFQLEDQLKKLEEELKSKRDLLQTTKDKIQKAEVKLNEYQNEINVLDANISQNLQQIQVIEASAFAHYDKDALEDKAQKTQTSIDKIMQDYDLFTKQLLSFRTKYAQIKGTYIEAQEQHALYANQLKEIQQSVNKLLNELNFPDVATVKSILDKNLNTSVSRKSVQDFYVAYSTLENRIQELQKIAEQDNYSEDRFNELSHLIQLKKEELNLQIEIYGALKDDLDRLTIELAKKQELLLEYQKLDTRKKNLDILFNMFKGNGFVNYVSSIHLQRLCEIANHRFHRLTKNQLSLVINENNEFEVIDYLNNGYRRSAKTLSGGQAFQASLCLALALAENIQSLNKADKNFFFIDEGFGTQDLESINTVFDTLQYLHQENRVVGIISHVEELKERMPRSITVIKDLEKGSQIMLN
jgi:exonuclease SbcC